jgi:hypothetical protein
MKKTLYFLLALGLSFSACKKEKESPTEKPEDKTINQLEDNNDLKAAMDQSDTDVDDALNQLPGIKGGRIAATNTQKQFCGCSIDSIGPKNFRLVFDGITSCGNPSRIRSGTITFTLIQGNNWWEENAKLSIVLNNYKVLRESDQKSWTINGTKFKTNVLGTNWIRFMAKTDTLLFRERASNMTCLVEKGGSSATITYNIARTTSWKYVTQSNRNYIQFAALGDTLLNGLSNVDTWGTNRFGTPFTNQYLSRLYSDSYCLFWRPRGGIIQHKSDGNTATVTFGVNTQGQTDTRDCAYGWKVNWVLANGSTGERIFSY